MRRSFIYGPAAAAIGIAAASAAYAQGAKAINTGGDKGAYHTLFCPPIPSALASAYFQGYSCTPSGGTVENLTRVLKTPTQIGFAQLDVLAREAETHPDVLQKITIIRKDIACEGLWMVTKNERLTNYGEVLAIGRRVPFVLPGSADPTKRSGAQATFEFLQSTDPNGLGQAKNVRYVNSTTDMINTVAASPDNAVGFFVQFADPENPNIKLIKEKKLRVIPVVSREITKAKLGDQSLYEVQTFNLSASGFFVKGDEVTTACTPVAIFTGNPETLSGGDKTDQAELIQKVREVPSAKMLPQDSRIAKLISSAKRVSGAALEELSAGADLARKKFEDLNR